MGFFTVDSIIQKKMYFYKLSCDYDEAPFDTSNFSILAQLHFCFRNVEISCYD